MVRYKLRLSLLTHYYYPALPVRRAPAKRGWMIRSERWTCRGYCIFGQLSPQINKQEQLNNGQDNLRQASNWSEQLRAKLGLLQQYL